SVCSTLWETSSTATSGTSHTQQRSKVSDPGLTVRVWESSSCPAHPGQPSNAKQATLSGSERITVNL
uniref:Uncharacterized protein n=1 Tax=Gasterosteus aculeatus TaxID=69293 RepID=G3PE29_GASAC